MSITYSIKRDIDPKELTNACSAAQKILTVQVFKDTVPFVPARTRAFSNSTRIIGNHIIYSGVQTGYLYEGVVRVNAKTGRGPFYIPGVGFRYKKGTVTKPTGRKLNFYKGTHPRATDHWPEASFEANKEKWDRVFTKAVEKYGNR